MASRIASSSAVLAVVAALVAGSAAGAHRPDGCVVAAAPGTNDAALNALSLAGAAQAQSLGLDVRVYRPSSTKAYGVNLRACAATGAAVTVGVGMAMVNAVDAVGTALPQARFAILDASVTTLPHRPANVSGLLFNQQQAGYLAGYAAGLWAKRHGGKAVGSVGGIDIPPVERFLAGFRFGAQRAVPGLKVLTSYAQDPSSRASCRSAALDEIMSGADVVFQAAGRCGLGALDAAHDQSVVGIGSVSDQGVLGPWVITSAVERADNVVKAAIVAAAAGTLRTGADDVFGARRAGVAYGAWSPAVPAPVRSAAEWQERLLAAGRIAGIPTTVG